MDTFKGINIENSKHSIVLSNNHDSCLYAILSDSGTKLTGDHFNTRLSKIDLGFLFEKISSLSDFIFEVGVKLSVLVNWHILIGLLSGL